MALLKFVTYGLVGYTLYTFVRNTIQLETQQRQHDGSSAGGGGSGEQGASADQQYMLSGPGEGQDVIARQPDGGVMHHTVGRGVVSR